MAGSHPTFRPMFEVHYYNFLVLSVPLRTQCEVNFCLGLYMTKKVLLMENHKPHEVLVLLLLQYKKVVAF